MKHSPEFTPTEFLVGFIYFLFQLIGIPELVKGVNLLLGSALSEAMLNTVFFAINFVAVLIIFPTFLKANFQIACQHPWNVLRCAGIGFLMYLVGDSLFTSITTVIAPSFCNPNDATINQLAQSNYWLMVIATVVLVPIAEECFYRGLIFRGLCDYFPVLAYVVSMVFFSLVHVLGYASKADFGTLMLSFLQYLPAGFALAWSYQASGTIYTPLLIHMIVNLKGICLMR